jgi:hypothetical protein
MAQQKHIPYIVFAQDPATFEVLDDVVCDTKAEAEGESVEMEAEMSCYAEGMPDIFVEKLNSEKVRRTYGLAEQQRLLRDFC